MTFLITKTYTKLTQESLEQGEYAEQDFVIGYDEPQELTLDEIIEHLNTRMGYVEINDYGEGFADFVETHNDWDVPRGTLTWESLHVTGAPDDIDVLVDSVKKLQAVC